MANVKLYTPQQIADEVKGITPQLVTRHLRATYPKLELQHDFKQHWRLTQAQFKSVCATLKSAKLACPDQPLHALKMPQKFIVFG